MDDPGLSLAHRLQPATAVHALVPAAGRGLRFGGILSKQFELIAGRPLLAWTLDRLVAAGVDSVTVALAGEIASDPPGWLRVHPTVRAIAGGPTRQASVALALSACPAKPGDLVLVHDGARPALDGVDLLAVCQAALNADGAVLGRRVSDTVKRLDGDKIAETIERSSLFRAETPQVFWRQVLERAFAAATRARFEGTDESALVERLPGTVVVAVEARAPNPKLTTAADLPQLRALLETRPN
ncbi:MAG: IspD/TarI family cytidylyltransferase [Thermoanaerobaculia bacterium]